MPSRIATVNGSRIPPSIYSLERAGNSPDNHALVERSTALTGGGKRGENIQGDKRARARPRLAMVICGPERFAELPPLFSLPLQRDGTRRLFRGPFSSLSARFWPQPDVWL